VHDRVSGNKLFADKVWYVRTAGQLSAFLLKEAALEWAKKNDGKLLTYAEAQKTAAS
jgi:NitT/TauT family transport system substrate-binding protein